MSFYERPEFTIVRKEKPFEIRRYESFHGVTYSYEEDKTLDQGFQTLFKYLSKENDENVKISMTVPVIEVKKRTDSENVLCSAEGVWCRSPEAPGPQTANHKI